MHLDISLKNNALLTVKSSPYMLRSGAYFVALVLHRSVWWIEVDIQTSQKVIFRENDQLKSTKLSPVKTSLEQVPPQCYISTYTNEPGFIILQCHQTLDYEVESPPTRVS